MTWVKCDECSHSPLLLVKSKCPWWPCASWIQGFWDLKSHKIRIMRTHTICVYRHKQRQVQSVVFCFCLVMFKNTTLQIHWPYWLAPTLALTLWRGDFLGSAWIATYPCLCMANDTQIASSRAVLERWLEVGRRGVHEDPCERLSLAQASSSLSQLYISNVS